MQDISSRTPVPISPGNSLKSINNLFYEPANSKNKKIKPTTTIVLSPFKKALFWLDQMPGSTKRRRKEKIPSVITSRTWHNYYEKKEQEKRDKELQKLKRVKERQKKQELRKVEMETKRKNRLALKENKNKSKDKVKKKKIRQKDSSSDSTEDEEWEESGSTVDDISLNEEQNDSDLENICRKTEQDFAFKEGDFVLVSFPGKKKLHL
ncbi:hypothetical protein JTB14_019755 [Gonioctena quinquepunctata]|nr:hypothetical protein JTB14_019755 [Gonioctena quinquepunctata]